MTHTCLEGQVCASTTYGMPCLGCQCADDDSCGTQFVCLQLTNGVGLCGIGPRSAKSTPSKINGALVGGIAGGVVGGILIIVCIVLLYKKRQSFFNDGACWVATRCVLFRKRKRAENNRYIALCADLNYKNDAFANSPNSDVYANGGAGGLSMAAPQFNKFESANFSAMEDPPRAYPGAPPLNARQQQMIMQQQQQQQMMQQQQQQQQMMQQQQQQQQQQQMLLQRQQQMQRQQQQPAMQAPQFGGGGPLTPGLSSLL